MHANSGLRVFLKWRAVSSPPAILNVILFMEATLQTLYEKLNSWSSPRLLPCSFASTANPRGSAEPLSSDELDLVLYELSQKLDFEGSLIPGKQFVSEWPIEPEEEDFETLDEFERAHEAYEELWPSLYDPKPWLMSGTDSNVERELLDAMTWSINNKSYELTNEAGEISYVAFSHQPDEARLIAEQEVRHQALVNEFALNASKLFAGESVSLCRSNHQLDTDMDESIADCYEGCFFDRTLAFVSEAHVLMVWVGHLRWYG